MKQNKSQDVCISEKGVAIWSAIKSGLMPEVEGGWDDSKFNAFWDMFISERNYILPRANQSNEMYFYHLYCAGKNLYDPAKFGNGLSADINYMLGVLEEASNHNVRNSNNDSDGGKDDGDNA